MSTESDSWRSFPIKVDQEAENKRLMEDFLKHKGRIGYHPPGVSMSREEKQRRRQARKLQPRKPA